MEFDKIGRVVKHTDKLGLIETWSYDARDRVVSHKTDVPATPGGPGAPPPPEETFVYDAAGQVTSQTDYRGYTTSYTYDSIGQLTKITLPDPDGAGANYSGVVQLSYDNLGRQTAITDSLGRVTTIAYNSRGWVASVTRPDPDGTGSATAPVTSYTYLTNGLMSTITDPLSRVVTYSYDNLDRETSVTLPDPDGGGSLTSPVLSKTYDAMGNILTSTDPRGNTTTYAYDKLYRQTTVTQADPDGGGSLTAPVTTYTYNDNGQLSKITDAMSRETTFGYDTSGRRTTVTDNQGNVTTTNYNGKDQVTSIVTPDPDGAGSLTASTTSYTYDNFGRIKTVTDANGGVTTTSYDAMGNVTSVKDSLNNTTTWTYDGLGRRIQETNQLGKSDYTFYDMAGNVAKRVDRNGNAVQYGYDDLDRIVSEKWYTTSPAPTATATTTVQGSGGTFDEVQDVGVATGAMGILTGGTFTLTYSGQTTGAIAYNASASAVQSALEALSNIGTGDVAVTKTTDTSTTQLWQLAFQGALAGTNLSQTTLTSSVTGVGLISVTQTTTTEGGPLNVNEQQTVTLSSATGGTFRLAYNNVQTADLAYNASTSAVQTALETIVGSGNVSVTGSAGNYTVTFVGALAATNVPQLGVDTSQLLSGSLNRTLTYAYDAAGQLTSASDAAASYTYSYDGLGQITSTTQSISGLTPTISYAQKFDAAGNRTELTATIGSTADFKNTYTYDNLNRRTTTQQTGQSGGNAVATKLVDFAYNALGQFTTISRYQNTSRTNIAAETTYTYDTLNRLATLTHKQGSTTLAGYTFTLDNMNRFTSIVSATDGTTNYTHDKANQLTAADHTSQNDESYTYDANGNRTGGSYTVTTDNRTSTDGTYNYTYDDEGNRITKTKISDGSKEEYTWDQRNRLTGVTFKNSSGTVLKTLSYAYDIFNQLVRRTYDSDGPGSTAATDRFFSNLDGQVQLQFEGTGASTLSHRYLWGQIDQLLSDENVSSLSAAGNILWTLADHLGTIRDIADQNESTNVTTVTNHRVFDSFGKLVSQTNSGVDVLFAFTARMRDDVSLLQYNLNRWYDAALGQWLSDDPIGFTAGDPNLRRYAGNGVLGAIDPTGLEAIRIAVGPGVDTPQWMKDDIAKAKIAELNPTSIFYPGNRNWFDDWLDFSANHAAGFGDTISGGITEKIRLALGINDGVDKDSLPYLIGSAEGVVWHVVFAVVSGNPCQLAKAPLWAMRTIQIIEGAGYVNTVLDVAQEHFVEGKPWGWGDIPNVVQLLTPGLNWFGRFLPGCFAEGTLVHLSAIPESDREILDGITTLAEARAGLSALAPSSTVDSAFAVADPVKTPIEQVPLGARVATKNPRPEEYDFTFFEPEQEDWLKISAQVRRADNSIVDIEWLRPANWVRDKGLVPGSSLNIQLPELELDGPGVVLAIDECPPIADGEGSVVTGRIVTRDANGLVRVTFDDGESLRGTAIHPVWSLDRQDWVPQPLDGRHHFQRQADSSRPARS